MTNLNQETSRANARRFIARFGIDAARNGFEEFHHLLEVNGINLDDIKQLLDSYDLVIAWGGKYECEKAVKTAFESQTKDIQHAKQKGLKTTTVDMLRALGDWGFLKPKKITIVSADPYTSMFVKLGQVVDVEGWTAFDCPYITTSVLSQRKYPFVFSEGTYMANWNAEYQ